MSNSFLDAFAQLGWQNQLFFVIAIVVAFGFEFINGFHDTANAVTTVIYTRTLSPTPAVLFSGICNFLGALLGGTAVAFAIVNLLPVDLLIESSGATSVVMVLSLLLAGVIWNLGTWYMGLPVSSSHTLIGSIMGVGLTNSLMKNGNFSGISWSKAYEVGLSLLISPIIGFVLAAGVLLLMRRLLINPALYQPPGEGDNPPRWVRYVLLSTCGGVSFAHGSNDGQKGMGLIMLALIGFMPGYYALNINNDQLCDELAKSVASAQKLVDELPAEQIAVVQEESPKALGLLSNAHQVSDIPSAERWQLRRSIFRIRQQLKQLTFDQAKSQERDRLVHSLSHSIEYIPLWVIVGTALALGIGTTIGYKRIVTTVAEKIGKTHLNYAQGAAAESIAACTIVLADVMHLPVSTTQVLSSGIAGTMWANNSGIQNGTLKKIGLAWLLTFPACIGLAAVLFAVGSWIVS